MTKKGPSESFLPATARKDLTELDEPVHYARCISSFHFFNNRLTDKWSRSPLKKWSTFFYAM